MDTCTIYRTFVLLTGIHRLEGFDNISEGKTATQSTVHKCNPPCGPDKVIDGERKTCMKGSGIGKGSPDKYFWWSVDLGSKHGIYSISIYFKDYKGYGDYEMRQRGRFAGFSLYISDTPKKEDGHPCYKNTLPLPPVEFNTTCIGYGRYVIYYNERLDGVTYPEGYQIQSSFTELCEVQIQGCRKGFYGSNCSSACPINCLEQRCHIVNGTCFGCTHGYTGEICEEECEWGFYGMECKRQCEGHCKRNLSCNHVTGYCDEGCAAGWMGKQCDQECENKTYGPSCVSICSDHCLNNTFCNKENGFCKMGCDFGYSGNLCNEACPVGLFGQNCSNRCSKNCINGICSNVDGVCIDGCSKGYTGMRCLYFYQEGYFGENCSTLCPRKCSHTCHHAHGTCIEDKASSNKWEIGFSVSAALNGLLLLCFAVFISFNRRKLHNFFQGKKRHRIPKNRNETNIRSTCSDVQTDFQKQFYEDLNNSENRVQYEELKVENKVAYENLEITNI